MGNTSGRDTRALTSQQRREQVCRLRAEGLTLEEIGDRLDVHKSTIKRDVATAIAMAAEKTVEAALDLRKLDAEGIAEDLERTEYDLGRIDGRLDALDAQRGADGESLAVDPDTMRVLTSLIDTKTKLIAKRTELRARRAKMFGVDEPDRVESTVRAEATPAEAMRLMQEQFKGDVGPKPDSDGGPGQDERGAP